MTLTDRSFPQSQSLPRTGVLILGGLLYLNWSWATVHHFEDAAPREFHDPTWSISNGAALSGAGSFQSATVDPGQQSSAFYTLTGSGPVLIRFAYLLEGNCCDSLSVFGNGERLAGPLRSAQWRLAEFHATAGIELEFRYSKQQSALASNVAYIDNLAIIRPLTQDAHHRLQWVDAVPRNLAARRDSLPLTNASMPALVGYHDRRNGYFLTRSRWSGSTLTAVLTTPLHPGYTGDRLIPSTDARLLGIAGGSNTVHVHRTEDLAHIASYPTRPDSLGALLGDFDGDGRLDILDDQYIDSRGILKAYDLESGDIHWTADISFHPIVRFGSYSQPDRIEIALSSGQLLDLRTGTSLSTYLPGFTPLFTSVARSTGSEYLVFDLDLDELAIYDPYLNSTIGSLFLEGEWIHGFDGYRDELFISTTEGVYRHHVENDVLEPLGYKSPRGRVMAADIGGDTAPEIVHLDIHGRAIVGVHDTSQAGKLWSAADAPDTSPDFLTAMDLDGNGRQELITVSAVVDASPAVRDPFTLEVTHLMGAAAKVPPKSNVSSETTGIVSGQLGVSPGRGVVVLRRFATGDRLDIYDAETGTLVRGVELELPFLSQPTLLPGRGQIAALDEKAVVLFDLVDGTLVWQSTSFPTNIKSYSVEQLDADDALEIAVLTEDGVVTIIDTENHLYQRFIVVPGARAMATAYRTVYIASDSQVTQYDSATGDLIETIPVLLESDYLWTSEDVDSSYLFLLSDVREQVQLVELETSGSVEFTGSNGLTSATPSEPVVLNFEGGMMLLAIAEHALIQAQIGAPRIPAEPSLFADGFE